MNKYLLSACTLIVFLTCTGFTQVSTFSDVPADSRYYEAVNHLATAGIVSGCGDGTYRPTATITGGEYAAILYRLLYPGTGAPKANSGKWFTGYLDKLYSDDVITSSEFDFLTWGNVTWEVVWRTLLPQVGIYYYPASYYCDTSKI